MFQLYPSHSMGPSEGSCKDSGQEVHTSTTHDWLHICPAVTSTKPVSLFTPGTAGIPREGERSSPFLWSWHIWSLIYRNITETLHGDSEDHCVPVLAMPASPGCPPWSQERAWSWALLPKQLPGTVRKGVSRETEGLTSEKSMLPLQCHSRQPGVCKHNLELPENAKAINT